MGGSRAFLVLSILSSIGKTKHNFYEACIHFKNIWNPDLGNRLQRFKELQHGEQGEIKAAFTTSHRLLSHTFVQLEMGQLYLNAKANTYLLILGSSKYFNANQGLVVQGTRIVASRSRRDVLFMLDLVNRRVAVVSIKSIHILPAKFDVRRTVHNTIKKEDSICLPVGIKIKLFVYYNKKKRV